MLDITATINKEDGVAVADVLLRVMSLDT